MAPDHSPLTWDVFVAPSQLTVGADLPPRQQHRSWPPISATLISGERDAVLVDPLLTVAQGRVLGDWVEASGKNLTTVYVTHGHGDHFLGLGLILDRFPGARAVATPSVIELMRREASSKRIASFWEARFPGQIADRIAIAQPLGGDRFELEGHALVAIEVGHTDTDHTTCLYVPDIALVVAGDAAYNDVHLHLAESDAAGRSAWLRALETIEALEPRTVVAGHKRPERHDAPSILDETRQYIRDFDRVAAHASTARDLYVDMLVLHPDRLNPGALWSAARAVRS